MEGWRFWKSEWSARWNAPSILGQLLSRSRGGVGRARQRRDAAHRQDSAGDIFRHSLPTHSTASRSGLAGVFTRHLSMEDWATMREIMEAVRQAIPDASSKQPGQVLEFVLGALRIAQRNPIACPENDCSSVISLLEST